MTTTAQGLSTSRSLPILWLGAAAFAWALPHIGTSAPSTFRSPQNAYYLLSNAHYGMSLAAVCVAFAACYYLLAIVFKPPQRPTLGLAHLTLTVLGTTLIFTPVIALKASGDLGSNADVAAKFSFFNAVSSLGYVLTLVGVGVFAVLVFNAMRCPKV